MKKLIGSLFLAFVLAGCAASAFKTARENANLVTNGMTLAQVSQTLGMEPTHVTAGYAEWRRGNAQVYDGSSSGAIRVKLKNGIVYGIPEGGLFSLAAVKEQMAEKAQKLAASAAEREARQAAEDARKAAAVQELMTQRAAEGRAAANSIVICTDKVECTKSFSLAQIYVSEKSDQKIQVATDTIVETYNASEAGRIGIKIIKTPQKGSMESISITVQCKENDFNAMSCSMAREQIYKGFKPFIESSLQK